MEDVWITESVFALTLFGSADVHKVTLENDVNVRVYFSHLNDSSSLIQTNMALAHWLFVYVEKLSVWHHWNIWNDHEVEERLIGYLKIAIPDTFNAIDQDSLHTATDLRTLSYYPLQTGLSKFLNVRCYSVIIFGYTSIL